MPQITITIEEEEEPVIRTLLHLLSTMRGPHGQIITVVRNGRPLDHIIEDRVRIPDLHKRLETQ